MMLGFATVLLFIVAGIAFVFVHLFASSLVRPRKYSTEKMLPYECGEDPVGSPWVKFNVRFYVFALIFLIFDVEIIFLLPWAVAYRHIGPDLALLAFIEGMVFVGILVVGLAYVWAKKDLQWVKATDIDDQLAPPTPEDMALHRVEPPREAVS